MVKEGVGVGACLIAQTDFKKFGFLVLKFLPHCCSKLIHKLFIEGLQVHLGLEWCEGSRLRMFEMVASPKRIVLNPDDNEMITR